MCALRGHLSEKSAYLETAPVIPVLSILDLIPGGQLVDVHTRHARAAWSSSEPGAERVDRRRRAAGLQLDASVGPVSHPAVDAETSRLVRRRGAKADTLNAAPHDGPHPLQG
jgi:hypothetical protein